jgi:transcriptional adapter 3
MSDKINIKRISMSKNRTTFPSQPTAARLASKPLQIKSYGVGLGAPQYHALTSPCSPSDTTPNIPHVKCYDNAKLLPKYFQSLQKSPHDLLPAEDLDAVQQELELLLSTVSLRFRVLKSEIETLDKAERNKIKYMERQPVSPGGKKKRYEDKNKHREGPSKLMSSHHMKQSKIKQVIPSPSHTDDSLDAVPYFQQDRHQKDNQKLFLPKNDTPNKFWLSVEPYCMPITQEDLKLLDDLIEEYSGPLIPPIPELGPHYSQQWAADDLKDEQDNSNPIANKKSRGGSMQNGEVLNMMRKGEKLM